MKLENIFLLNCSNSLAETPIKINRLPLDDKELSRIQEKDIESKIKRRKLHDVSEYTESISKSKKYFIKSEDYPNSYQIKILNYLNQNLTSDIDDIKNIDEFVNNKKMLFNAILYFFTSSDDKQKKVYVFKLNKGFWLEDKTIIAIKFGKHTKKLGKRKLPTTTTNALRINQFEDGLTLPNDKCVGCFFIDSNSKVEVYDAFAFDDIFATPETQKEYADKTLKGFKAGKLKIAQNITTINGKSIPKENGIEVEIDENIESDEESIEDIISKSSTVRMPLANYTDNVKRTIKRIGSKELKRLIDELNNAIDDEEITVNFGKKNVPKIDLENNKIYVNVDSLPIFSAMLENKVIERLLSHEIDIPYYDEALYETLDVNKPLSWE